MAFLKAKTSRRFHHLRSEAAQMMMVDPMMILAGDYLAKDAGSFQGCLESAEAAAEAACDTWNNEHERERERERH